MSYRSCLDFRDVTKKKKENNSVNIQQLCLYILSDHRMSTKLIKTLNKDAFLSILNCVFSMETCNISWIAYCFVFLVVHAKLESESLCNCNSTGF